MPIIQIIVVLLAIGVILWAIKRFIPIDAVILNIIYAVVIIAVVLWLLSLFMGGFGSFNNLRFGR